MKRKQKSCQNEPSAKHFDGLSTRFDGVKTKPKEYHFNLMFGLKTNAMRQRPDTSVWLLFPAAGKK
jgi:hypothetical protein